MDTSTTPQQTYNLLTSEDEVIEGKGFKVKVKTKNIDPGQIINWKGFGPAASEGIAYFEETGLTSGTMPLDNEGKAILQFRTNKNILTASSADFNFALFETPAYETQITDTVTVKIVAA